jgi:hypothetical protein
MIHFPETIQFSDLSNASLRVLLVFRLFLSMPLSASASPYPAILPHALLQLSFTRSQVSLYFIIPNLFSSFLSSSRWSSFFNRHIILATHQMYPCFLCAFKSRKHSFPLYHPTTPTTPDTKLGRRYLQPSAPQSLSYNQVLPKANQHYFQITYDVCERNMIVLISGQHASLLVARQAIGFICRALV